MREDFILRKYCWSNINYLMSNVLISILKAKEIYIKTESLSFMQDFQLICEKNAKI